MARAQHPALRRPTVSASSEGASRRTLHAALLWALLFGCSSGTDAKDAGVVLDGGAPDAAGEPLQRLASLSQRRLEVQTSSGAITGVVLDLKVAGESPVARARAFLADHAAVFGVANAGAQLAPGRVVAAPDGDHVYFRQWGGEYPVLGAVLAVHLDGDRVMSLTARLLDEVPALPVPSLTERAAMIRALGQGTQGSTTASPRLFIVDRRLWGESDSRAHLAYRVPVRIQEGEVAGGYEVLVDAHTGEELERTPLEPTSDRRHEELDIQTAANTGEGITCWDAPWETQDDDWFDEEGPLDEYPGGPGAYPGGDMDGDLAFTGLHAAYHIYYDRFQVAGWVPLEILDSIALLTPEIQAMVHVGRNWRNAKYSGLCGNLQFGDGYAVNDVIAHELTHGVIRHTTDLTYKRQSGAINESYADMFGHAADPEDWTIGEDAGFNRSMSNPPSSCSTGIPGCPAVQCCTDHTSNFLNVSCDSGGVHLNSGISNKVFYLLVDGDQHNGIQVEKIGLDKALALAFVVMTSRLSESANFTEQGQESVEAARAFVRRGLFAFGARDVCQVINAFASVGVGDADRDCDGVLDGSDLDDDGDSIPDARDNCPGVANGRQTNTDGQGGGDACDDDDDQDGVLDTSDNCPLAPNVDQLDDDGDGIGEDCDDDDSDRVPNRRDNCRFVANYLQANHDAPADSAGDACDLDDDEDGVQDDVDNCPFVANPMQGDPDSDGVGNSCDNCPNRANPGQEDRDEDARGDACDLDDDNDGLLDDADNCSLDWNLDQTDLDDDGEGLACDEDENEILSGGGSGARDVGLWLSDQVWRAPLATCRKLACPDYVEPGTWLEVHLAVPAGVQLVGRIVDELGRILDRDQVVGPGRLSLAALPKADNRNRSTGGLPQGERFFFELLASKETPKASRIPAQLEVRTLRSASPRPDAGIGEDAAADAGTVDAAQKDAGAADQDTGPSDAGPPVFVQQVSGTSEELQTIAWDGRRYLVGGSAGTLLESQDALRWSPADKTGLGASEIITSLAHAPGADVWVLAARLGAMVTNLYRRGPADPRWVSVAVDLPNHSEIIWAGPPVERFVAVTDEGLRLSADGSTWATPPAAPPGPLYSATFSGTFIAIGGNFGQVTTSTDGVHWTTHDTTAQGTVFDLAAAGNQVVGITLTTSPEILVSDTAGATWSVSARAFTPASVGHTGRGFVIFEAQGALYSADGRGFAPILPWPYTWISAMTAQGPRVVAVGEAGRILTAN